jgi:hypothetical protein
MLARTGPVTIVLVLWLVLLLALPRGARAEGASNAAEKLQLNVDLGFATMYVWRGYNVFQERSPGDANLMLAPGISWEVLDTGLTVAYWSAYQLTGNVGENIDAGSGAEWDLTVSYSRSLLAGLEASGGVTLYLYPFADEAVAGTAAPTYLEPFVTLGYSRWGVELSLFLSYLIGVQEVLAPGRYIYVNPSAARSFELGEVPLELSLGLGVKIYTGEGDALRDNTVDLLLGVGWPLPVAGGVYVKPGVNLAWTNIAGRDLGQELLAWGGLGVGVDL